MAVSCGFFNAQDHDRLYDADQVNDIFEGILSPNGVYEAVGDAFIVKANNDMTVTVGTGRGFVGLKWVVNDSPEIVNISSSSQNYNRYTAVVFRLDTSTREITLETVDGDGAVGNPTKPALTRTSNIYEICLAYIFVRKGATSITQKDITDVRPDRNVCGWITGVVEQVDTTQLFLQYQQFYQEMRDAMESWMDNQMRAYASWFATLTQDLTINMYVACYEKHISGTSSQIQSTRLDMTGYTYDPSDIIFVFINGIMASPTDYTLNTQTSPVLVTMNLTNTSTETNELFIRVLQTTVGNPPSPATIVQIPTVTISTYVYDGTEQGPTITNLDTTYVDVGGDVEEIEPGTYTLVLSLINPSTTTWSDYTTAPKTYVWTIEREDSPINLSTNSVSFNRLGQTEDITVTYDGDGTLSATSMDLDIVTVQEV